MRRYAKRKEGSASYTELLDDFLWCDSLHAGVVAKLAFAIAKNGAGSAREIGLNAV